MKQIFVMFALLLGVCAANAQTTDTVKYVTGNDLYQGITRKLPNASSSVDIQRPAVNTFFSPLGVRQR